MCRGRKRVVSEGQQPIKKFDNYFVARAAYLARGAGPCDVIKRWCHPFPGVEEANAVVPRLLPNAGGVVGNPLLLAYCVSHCLCLAIAVVTPPELMWWLIAPASHALLFFLFAVLRHLAYGPPDDPVFGNSWFNAQLGYEGYSVWLRSSAKRQVKAYENAKKRDDKRAEKDRVLPKLGWTPPSDPKRPRLADRVASLTLGNIGAAHWPAAWTACYLGTLACLAIFDQRYNEDHAIYFYPDCSSGPNPSDECHVLGQYALATSALVILIGVYLALASSFESSRSNTSNMAEELKEMEKGNKVLGFCFRIMHAVCQDQFPKLFSTPESTASPGATTLTEEEDFNFFDMVTDHLEGNGAEEEKSSGGGEAGEEAKEEDSGSAAHGASFVGDTAAAFQDARDGDFNGISTMFQNFFDASLLMYLTKPFTHPTLGPYFQVLTALAVSFWGFALAWVRELADGNELFYAMAPALLGAITIYLGLAATCELVQLYKMTNALLLIVQMTPILSLLLVDQRYDTREETDASGNLMILKPLENGGDNVKAVLANFKKNTALVDAVKTVHTGHPIQWYRFRSFVVEQLVSARHSAAGRAVGAFIIAVIPAVALILVSVFAYNTSFQDSLILSIGTVVVFGASVFMLQIISLATAAYTEQQGHIKALEQSVLKAKLANTDDEAHRLEADIARRRPLLFLEINDHMQTLIREQDPKPRILGFAVSSALFKSLLTYITAAISALVTKVLAGF